MINADIFFDGDEGYGSVNLYVNVTMPDGSTKTHFGTLSDIGNGQTSTKQWIHTMFEEGTYKVQIIIKTTNNEHEEHIFDTQTKTIIIEPYGLCKNLESIGYDTDKETTYRLKTPEIIQPREIVLAVISLPEIHSYENYKIVNVNYEQFVKAHPKEAHITSNLGYDGMKLSLIKYQNLLPTAGAEERLPQHVMFYKVGQDMCNTVQCNSIDEIKEVKKSKETRSELFMISVIGIIALISVIVGIIFLMKNKETSQKEIKKVQSSINYSAKSSSVIS